MQTRFEESSDSDPERFLFSCSVDKFDVGFSVVDIGSAEVADSSVDAFETVALALEVPG